jgi:hypothetical protein
LVNNINKLSQDNQNGSLDVAMMDDNAKNKNDNGDAQV